MAKRMIELTLPEFAFVDGSGHESPNILYSRNVILHVRSMSVLEVLDWETTFINDGVLTKRFTYHNKYGLDEQMIIVLHHCATFDVKGDSDMILKYIIDPAIKWYCDYLQWEDDGINIYGEN